jgi:glutamate 5-kinase
MPPVFSLAQALAATQRLVLKLGSQMLVDAEGNLCLERLKALVAQCAQWRQANPKRQLVLVSSGAIALGRGKLGWPLQQALQRVQKQACAAAGQPYLMQTYQALFEAHGLGVAQVLLNPHDFSQRWRYLSAQQVMEELLSRGVVPILNENDALSDSALFEPNSDVMGTSFGDNDKLAALVAAQLKADTLLVLSNVEGIFTANPFEDPSAKRLACVEDLEALKQVATAGKSASGRGGMASKIEAVALAAQCGTHVVVASGLLPNAMGRVLQFNGPNEAFEATAIKAQPQTTGTGMKRWIGLASGYHGVLQVNEGAKQALLNEGASLLAVGLTAVLGDFAAQQVVSVQGEDEQEFARGVVGFGSQLLQRMVGLQSQQVAQLLGAEAAQQPVVHRDKLFLF